jgi:hypothetical protein
MTRPLSSLSNWQRTRRNRLRLRWAVNLLFCGIGVLPVGRPRPNSANPPSLFGQGIVVRYRRGKRCVGGPMAIRILNDLMLFSCLVALATRVL